ncbi:hypothetical protein ACFOYW_13405 [Gryllotalpicola reticulitermitis]|uniref:Uncharacterized protein n=1 Tax=Gryllotalpicola reticulitermitis TaxID=1184153 RepID=A0ABV8QA82_9MICO
MPEGARAPRLTCSDSCRTAKYRRERRAREAVADAKRREWLGTVAPLAQGGDWEALAASFADTPTGFAPELIDAVRRLAQLAAEQLG